MAEELAHSQQELAAVRAELAAVRAASLLSPHLFLTPSQWLSTHLCLYNTWPSDQRLSTHL